MQSQQSNISPKEDICKSKDSVRIHEKEYENLKSKDKKSYE